MRSLALIPLCLLTACAPTAAVSLHVDSARTAKLSPGVLEPIEGKVRATTEGLDREDAHAQERAAKAREALRLAQAEPRNPETDAVRKAKIVRAEEDLSVQQAMSETLRWRRAFAAAAAEVDKAELVSRCGQDIDVDSFKQQRERVRAGLNDAQRAASTARSRFEQAERKLNEAKAGYARQHGAMASAAPTM
jgi:hypothetical protein